MEIKDFLEFGSFRMEARRRVLTRDGEPVPLPAKAFEVLLALLQRPGETVSKDELMKAVWPDTFVEEGNLTQMIFLLRKALGDSDGQSLIITVPRQGYRFVGNITAAASGTARDLGAYSDESVCLAIDRIAASPLFAESERLSRFLRYIVAETLAERGKVIKEYTIGVEVYGRPADYDPKTDAIVRVEAGRLRTKLQKYYADKGAADPIRIELPRGTYIPLLSGAAVERPRQPIVGPARKHIAARVGPAFGLAFIGAVAALLWFRNPPVQRHSLLSIAVLPFVNASGDADTAHFATALVEEMTSTIARENAFHVASRTDSDRFRNSSPDLASVGAKRRVNGVLEGSVQRHGDGIRITVQLVHSPDGYHIWSQTYESLPGRTAEFQEKVSNLVGRTLRARFAGIPESAFGRPPTENREAMAFYLKGQEAWMTQRKPGLLESLEYYRRALEKDSSFAKAYEGIAASELYLSALDKARADDHVARAKAAALKAIGLDDRLDDAHARLGNIFLRREWNFAAAEQELQRAVMLAPGSSPITRWYAEAARLTEKYTRAHEELENALMANPNAEMIETELGMLDLELDRLAGAETHVRRSAAIDPNYRLNHLLAGLLHERAARFADAEKEFRSCSNQSEFGRFCLAALGHVYGAEKKTVEALQVVTQLEMPPNRSESLAAVVYAGAGDRELALRALEQAYQERDRMLPLVKIDWRFRPLRLEPRYRHLMGRLGLPVAVH
jgi:serine/threonine-protein kinase